MKKILKPLIGCIITISLTIALVQYVGHILDPKWSEDGLNVVEAFDSLEDNSLDVIVYGSSHAWKGCDTRVMYEDYGLAAYNYGCNWQSINTVLLFLQDSLRTQSPKVVCIETGLVDQIEKDVDMNGQIYYTRAMKNFDGKEEYLEQCFGDDVERYVSYYVPLVMFHDNWNTVDSENFRFPGPERYVATRGYTVGTEVVPFEIPDYHTFEQDEIPQDCVDVLDKMVEACRGKDIQIVFYTCPYAGTYAYADAMEKYAKENGCAYLNLFAYLEEMGLNGKTDLQDEGHLNESGAGKVAAFLSKYVIENYNVPIRENP